MEGNIEVHMQEQKSKFSPLGMIRAFFMLSSVIITTIIFGGLNCILYPFLGAFDRKRHIFHRVGVIWGRSIAFLNPWWKFNITGRHHLAKKDRAVVYVSNHQSQADIMAVYLLNTRFRWLAKSELFKIPFLGWGMAVAGYVPVQRGNQKSHEKCMKDAEDRLKKGIPMLFFPEGTRSKTGKIGNFKTGAFRLAKQNGVPVVPITIDGCAHLLPKNSIYPQPAVVNITVHAPLDSTKYTVEELMNISREVIASKLPKNLRD